MHTSEKNIPYTDSLKKMTFINWCHKNINATNFKQRGFTIEGTRRTNNINPKVLSSLEFDKIGAEIDFNENIVEPCYKQFMLPFGVPKNDEALHFYENMLENIYNDGRKGLVPNNNITASVLMSLIKFVVCTLARGTEKPDEKVEIYYIKILISLFCTLKKFIEKRPQIKDLISGISKCMSTNDAIQREIAMILDNKHFTNETIDQVITLSIMKDTKYHKELYGSTTKLTLTNVKFLKNMMSTLFVIPLLQFVSDFSDIYINMYYDNFKLCYEKLYQTGILSKMNNGDEYWQFTGQIIADMHSIISEVCGLKLNNLKCHSYFVDKLNREHDKIKKIDGYTNNLVWPSHIKQNDDIAAKCKKRIKNISKVNMLSDDKAIIESITSSCVTIDTFIIAPANNEIYGIKWETNKSQWQNCEHLEFDGENQDSKKKTKYGIDRYHPNEDQLVVKNKATILGHNCNELLLRRIDDNIELYLDTGKIIFKGSTLAVFFRNIKLEINKVKL